MSFQTLTSPVSKWSNLVSETRKVHRNSLSFFQRCVLTAKNTPYRDGYYYLVQLSPVDKTKSLRQRVTDALLGR